jgi:hypothetical protein
MTITSISFDSNAYTVTLPIYPAPPVTNTCIYPSFISGVGQIKKKDNYLIQNPKEKIQLFNPKSKRKNPKYFS